MLFSVIIPVLNREGHIGRAIDSILSQDFSDFEIIAVDNGSTDRTPDVLRSYGDPVVDPGRTSATIPGRTEPTVFEICLFGRQGAVLALKGAKAGRAKLAFNLFLSGGVMVAAAAMKMIWWKFHGMSPSHYLYD